MKKTRKQKITCVKGYVVETDDLTWEFHIPSNSRGSAGEVNRQFIYWTDFPITQRSKIMGMAQLMMEEKGADNALGFVHGVRWVYRFLAEERRQDFVFNKLTETEWGGFAKWLEEQIGGNNGVKLKDTTRRGYFVHIKSAIRTAAFLGKFDVTYEDLETIEAAMRRRFRDANLLAMYRASKRALNEDETLNLLEIINEEWNAWREFNATGKIPLEGMPDLLAIAATILCFEETVRPEELNVMEVKHIRIGEAVEILLCAPNKAEGYIEVSKETAPILKELIEYGSEARRTHGTDKLFIDGGNVLGSNQLNKRLRKLLKKYWGKYPVDRPGIRLSDGRKTLGAYLASTTNDEEVVRLILRHADVGTTKIYYVRQGKAQLSRNIRNALKEYALRFSRAYNPAVLDPIAESRPEIAEVLKRNPDHTNIYGACTEDKEVEGDCEKGIHCGDCPLLIPMVSKLKNFEIERDLYLSKVATAENDRDIEHLLAHAGMLEGHILNIKRKMKIAGVIA
ncbi:hypothetical protein SD70_26210 [Gordoniibacillus kamchatkensis]|uniref:Tyr recombinase domain-containing protein n=1 Tax=Gordoniibacillus kamchatkensis TaxID=1590651 RepID=A0ABR5ACQ5_9BACL|nr:site-specific integrase [Paenibacillus sp. VKM B-2647]KIL38463.1 hypothetical protein SD70_26210 [Paenibacillus sp. VKM B-2647]